MKFFAPKPPPTSGATHTDPRLRHAKHRGELVAHGMHALAGCLQQEGWFAASHCARAARGSIAAAVTRLFTRSSVITECASAMAASTAAASPFWKRKARLPGASSKAAVRRV